MNWLETWMGIDLDGGNGVAEWAIIAGVAAIVALVLTGIRWRRARRRAAALTLLVLGLIVVDRADAQAPVARSAADAVPTFAFTYAAAGVAEGTWGGAAFGFGLLGNADPVGGGGGLAWVSPVDRLTVLLSAQRNVGGDFSPEAAAVVRVLGDARGGFVLGGLAKLKVEGFGREPGPGRAAELESELEVGLLAGYRIGDLRADLNAIAGFGLGDDGEVDLELRARVGYQVGDMIRVGADAQIRGRAAGTFLLPGGRTHDFVAGPEIVVAGDRLFAALVTGPATFGVVDRGVGWMTLLSFGGAL